jgi:hypothetical protein
MPPSRSCRPGCSAAQVDYVYSLLLGWIIDKLARSPGFAGRPDRHEVEAALGRVAYRVLAQRDWGEDAPTAAISEAISTAGIGGRS